MPAIRRSYVRSPRSACCAPDFDMRCAGCGSDFGTKESSSSTFAYTTSGCSGRHSRWPISTVTASRRSQSVAHHSATCVSSAYSRKRHHMLFPSNLSRYSRRPRVRLDETCRLFHVPTSRWFSCERCRGFAGTEECSVGVVIRCLHASPHDECYGDIKTINVSPSPQTSARRSCNTDRIRKCVRISQRQGKTQSPPLR
jgi:hypothetical protein